MLAVMKGPPPRARGRPAIGRGPTVGHGTTPACAGTTAAIAAASARRRDHPCVRGDDMFARYRFRSVWGPPPRARGRRCRPHEPGANTGTTPACAETTSTPLTGSASSRDHPRVRGDDSANDVIDLSAEGPPPRARGRQDVAVQLERLHGTTPACAGTTWLMTSPQPARGDHPRVRGDDPATRSRGRASAGPPPRARGRPPASRPRAHTAGTTPACAGTTRRPLGSETRAGDHPRVRGDDGVVLGIALVALGPPPRARGRRGPAHRRRPGRGTTPACAGTTQVMSHAIWSTRDHPRVRGDDLHQYTAEENKRGPPPRARGRLSRLVRCGRRSGDHPRVRGDDHGLGRRAPIPVGTTPACAGTTSWRRRSGR